MSAAEELEAARREYAEQQETPIPTPVREEPDGE